MAGTQGVAKMLDSTTLDQGKSKQKPVVWSAFPPSRCGAVPSAHRWYVVATAPGRERGACQALESAGFGTFLPMVEETRPKRRVRWGREFIENRKAIVCAFPGYLFVSFDVAGMAWRSIHRMDDVGRIISSAAERPIPVGQAAMAVLMAHAYDRTMVTDPTADLIEAGAQVRVLDGPFVDHLGVCQVSRRDRIAIMVSLFGRETLVEMAVHEVEKVEA